MPGTYQYEPGNIAEYGKDRMRFELGDVMVEGKEKTCALCDEEYNAILPEKIPTTRQWKKAKLRCLESIMRKFAFEPDTKVGPLSLSMGERAKLWKEMYEDLKKYIAKQLKEIKAKYALPRKTRLIYEEDVSEYTEEDYIENYNVHLVLTRDGFFKKITLLSLRASSIRGSDEHKLKEGDVITYEQDAENINELLFVSDRQKIYKARVCDFDQVKASSLGEFVPAKLDFDDGEKVIAMRALKGYEPSHNIIYIFKNGKGVKIPVSSYETKANRKKLINAYSDASPIVAAIYESEPFELMLGSKNGKAMIINTKLIPIKNTRTSIGVTLFTLKKDDEVKFAIRDYENEFPDTTGLRKTKIPSSGSTLK